MQLSLTFLATLLVSSVSSGGIDDDETAMNEQLRLNLWSRGAFDIDKDNFVDSTTTLSMRMQPVSYVRQDVLRNRDLPDCEMTGFCSVLNRFRGGSQSVDYDKQLAVKIEELGAKYGKDFLDAIEKNKEEHEEDCKKSCELYYCANPHQPLTSDEELMGKTTIKSYSMGPVPPEDFAESFG